jgi:FdhE protein
MSSQSRILEPGEIEAPVGQIRTLRLAEPDVFAHRAERFKQLSKGHSFSGYLAFLGSLAQAQQEALAHFPSVPLPTSEQQALCREHGMPVLGCQSWPRDPAWKLGITSILQYMSSLSLATPANEVISRLKQASDAELEDIAGKLLSGNLASVNAQDMPFIAAALQVYWVHMAAALGEQAFMQLDQAGLCPVCGSHPVAGIVRIGGSEEGLRYLSCSLCASEWHMVRIKCSNCESTHGINYFELEGSNGSVKAENCDDCGTYLKLLNMAKDHQVEAVADDLATLALDLLMDEAGKSRGGPNLFFHPGSV